MVEFVENKMEIYSVEYHISNCTYIYIHTYLYKCFQDEINKVTKKFL